MDRLDRMLTIVWTVLGTGLFLRPTGWVGWTDLALWAAAVWMVSLAGLWYLVGKNSDPSRRECE